MVVKKEEIKYKRIGKCKNCGICCLFKDKLIRVKKNSDSDKFYRKIGYNVIKEELKKSRSGKNYKINFLGKISGCPHLMFDKGKFKCLLHGKKCQPQICKTYPNHPTQDYYEIFKDFCGYKFVKIKEKKIKGVKK